MATKQPKAKRVLKDVTFEHEGAHVALVSKDQGGPANAHDYALVMKANYSKEFIQKMQQVQVTLELPEFLRKFFNVYYEDAEVLARMMGYVEPEDESGDMDSYEDYYEKRIEERLASYTILKSLENAENIPAVLAGLSEDQYLTLLQDQEKLEKALLNSAKGETKAEEGAAEATVKSEESVNVEKAEAASSGETNELEKSVVDKTKEIKPEVKVEMVEKSALEAVQKALDEQKEQLTKALAAVAAFEAEKKEAVAKAKTEKVKAVVKNEAHVEAIAKAALSLESEGDFDAFLASLQAMLVTVEASDMFVEKGATSNEEKPVAESAVARVLKAQLKK